jgi:PIN domain nuclease of toxin-antitoxin system
MIRHLLDTHALIWWLRDAPELTRNARGAIMNEMNSIFFSPANVYEIAFKQHCGRLERFSLSPTDAALAQGFVELPMAVAHAERAARLPLLHGDPWDRIIAGQAIVEDMIVLTRDPRIAVLGAKTLW